MQWVDNQYAKEKDVRRKSLFYYKRQILGWNNNRQARRVIPKGDRIAQTLNYDIRIRHFIVMGSNQALDT